jgi:hypothetical protein
MLDKEIVLTLNMLLFQDRVSVLGLGSSMLMSVSSLSEKVLSSRGNLYGGNTALQAISTQFMSCRMKHKH